MQKRCATPTWHWNWDYLQSPSLHKVIDYLPLWAHISIIRVHSLWLLIGTDQRQHLRCASFGTQLLLQSASVDRAWWCLDSYDVARIRCIWFNSYSNHNIAIWILYNSINTRLGSTAKSSQSRSSGSEPVQSWADTDLCPDMPGQSLLGGTPALANAC